MTYKTGQDLIDEAKRRIKEVTPQDVQAMQQRGDAAIYLDVRESAEWNLGHLPQAMHLSRGNLEGKIEGLVDRSRRIVVYCAAGNRSALAADTLVQMGYDAVSMSGGFREWAETGGEVDG